MQFEGTITKMARKRMINVPAKEEGFAPGDRVKVTKSKKGK